MEWAERIGRRVRLRDLHILLAVAQCGSMAKAAERLAVSQPVISKVIADLEHVLGVRVLDRDRHGAEPTVYGRALLHRGLAAFDELRQGVKEIEFLLDPTAGELRVGATEPMVMGLVPAIIDRLSRQYPRINYHVMRVQTDLQQYRHLREREVELVIGRLPRAVPDQDLNVEVLFDEPILVAAGLQSKWLRRRRIELAELINEPWVLPESDSLIGMLVADLFHARGLGPPTQGVVCGSIHINNALLATGRYLAIYSHSLLKLSAKRLSIKALPVNLPAQSSRVGIVTLRNRTPNPIAKLFTECARALTNSLGLSASSRSRQRVPESVV
jgi:DNA-binding transcriptional LysR family regulator